MAKELVLISHGDFCEALKKSTEMLMGVQDSIYTVSLQPEDSLDSFREKLMGVIDGLSDYVIIADVMGGTPCNVASRLVMEGYQFDLYAGMNMPMVIGFLNGSLLDTDVDLLVYGRENIHHINDLLDQSDDLEEDEF